MDYLKPGENRIKSGNQPGLKEPCQENSCRYYMNSLDGTMKIYEDETLSSCIKHSPTEDMLQSCIKRGNMHYNKENYTDGLIDYNEALRLAYRINAEKSLAAILNKMGCCYLQLMDYNNAAIYFNKALNACCHKEEQRSLTLYNLSLCYYGLEKYEKAVELLNRCEGLKMGTGMDKLHYSMLILKGGALIECGRLGDAEKLFVDMLETLKEDSKDRACCLHSLGTIYSRMGKYKKAEINYENAIAIRKNADRLRISVTLIEIGQMYRLMDMEKKAADKIKEGIEYARAYGASKDIIKAFRALEQVYKEKKDLDGLEEIYIMTLSTLDGNKKMLNYRDQILNKMGILYLEKYYHEVY